MGHLPMKYSKNFLYFGQEYFHMSASEKVCLLQQFLKCTEFRIIR